VQSGSSIMTVIRNSTILPCTPEEAFDYLPDLRNELEWNPDCTLMEKISDGPVGLGTKFRAQWKGSPVVEVEIVEYERPRRWKAHNDGPLEFNFAATLEPVAEGTRLSVDFGVRPRGWFRLTFPALLLFLRRAEKANMTRVREVFERRATAARAERSG
jgi:uncharacterized protein YndB with AHSA1/START domain